MPLNFTLRYTDQLTDVGDTTGDLGLTPGIGSLLFTPIFNPGDRIPYGLESGLGPRAFPAYLDTDGQLKDVRGGTAGIRLWANDPAFNVSRFAYRVTAPSGYVTDQLGNTVPWRIFEFDAPSVDTTLYLKNVMPRPGQRFGRGPAVSIAGGTFPTDDTVVLQNTDGSETTPIEISPAALVFVDNGDGTWSAG